LELHGKYFRLSGKHFRLFGAYSGLQRTYFFTREALRGTQKALRIVRSGLWVIRSALQVTQYAQSGLHRGCNPLWACACCISNNSQPSPSMRQTNVKHLQGIQVKISGVSGLCRRASQVHGQAGAFCIFYGSMDGFKLVDVVPEGIHQPLGMLRGEHNA